MQENLLTISELCAWLQVDRTTVYRLARQGRIPYIRVGGRYRFAVSDIERWLQANREPAGVGD